MACRELRTSQIISVRLRGAAYFTDHISAIAGSCVLHRSYQCDCRELRISQIISLRLNVPLIDSFDHVSDDISCLKKKSQSA